MSGLRRKRLRRERNPGNPLARAPPPSRLARGSGITAPNADQEPRLLLADAPDLRQSARLDLEGVHQPLAADRAQVDTAGLPQVFKPRREVHRISPHVIAELAGSDDPGEDGPGSHA